jgi:ArsR family transcriptional regulator
LKEMTHAGLIKPVQEGRFIYYAANYKTMNGLVGYLTENCCQGSACDTACAPILKRRKKGA